MAAKGYSLSNEPDIGIDKILNDHYRNLNLNSKYQNFHVDNVGLKSISKNSRKVQNNYDFDDFQAQKELCNKSNKHLSPSSFSNTDSDEKDEIKKSKLINKSTLSLHISAYESLIEAKNDTSNDDEREEALKQKSNMIIKCKNAKQFFSDSPLIIQNPFEFPRQQKGRINKPEMMQFKASQRLLNPYQAQDDMTSVFIVDNGSYSIKAGYKDDLKPKVIPNYIFKTSADSYVGNEIDNCPEPSNLYLNSPFERGYLVHMDIQNEIWQDIFGRRQFGLNFSDTKLVLTDSNLTVPTIETSVREILFETYGFHSLQLASAPGLVAQYHYEKTKIPHSLIVDSGHSFTHILPCLSGKICVERSMRIDVGGKIMTNFLRDKLTYSQYDLRQETKVVNEMKEDVCYFAKDFRQEMELFKKSNPVIDYYLPDHNLLRRGQIKHPTDLAAFKDLNTISLGVERFVLPETIFFPEITDCDQIGLKEAINRTCNGVFNYNLFGRYMLKNIIVFGGNAAIPGLKERLCYDLSNAFEAYDVPENIKNCINVSSNPIIEPWLSAQYLINNVPSFSTKFVSKKEYQENGNRICDERFIDNAPKEWFANHPEDASYVDENGMPIVDSDDEFETSLAETYVNPKAVAVKPVIFHEPQLPVIQPPPSMPVAKLVSSLHIPVEEVLPSSSTTNIMPDQLNNNINEVIPQNIQNNVIVDEDADIMEVDYIPPPSLPPTSSPSKPLIRAILKPRRIFPTQLNPTTTGRQPTILQKVISPQRILRRPEPGSPPSSNIQYYTTVPPPSEGILPPTRFIHIRPTRILHQPDIQHQHQPHHQRYQIRPSSSFIRIRSPTNPALNLRSPIHSQGMLTGISSTSTSEMPILRPQISRQVPIMLPRGMLSSSSSSGIGTQNARSRTLFVRRNIHPRQQYIPLQPQPSSQQHQHQHQQQPPLPSTAPAPTTNFQQPTRQGLEEEYESGESGPSTPL